MEANGNTYSCNNCRHNWSYEDDLCPNCGSSSFETFVRLHTNNIESQNKRIKDCLMKGKSLTALDALYQFGCFRLGARIHDLKAQGMKIKSEMITITSAGKEKRVAKYSLIK